MKDRTVAIESTQEFTIGDIDFEPFCVPHDAVDNFGFVAKSAGVKVATLTDFGCFTQLMKEKLDGCDAIVIESNHSRDMLRLCSVYTWSLKQRIASRHGHLSNEATRALLSEIACPCWRRIYLTHISRDCNSRAAVELAFAPVRTVLQACEISIVCKGESTPLYEFAG